MATKLMTFPRSLTFIFITVMVARILAATILPVVQDEAYYFLWAHYLDWGYFDHPPGVALTAVTSLLGSSPLLGRLGALLIGGATIPLIAHLFYELGLRKNHTLTDAVALTTFSVAGLVGGVLVAPDALMIFAWVGALWAAARALNGHLKWWLIAGAFTGIGLLAKYIMLIIGPVFLWGLLRGSPKQLKTPWPYLGGVVAFIIFLPHLLWNAQNDWITFRFQIKHGLVNAHDIAQDFATELPVAREALEGSAEYLLAQNFVDPGELEPKKRERGPWEQRRRRYEEFIGGQIALWGALLFALIPIFATALWNRRWLPFPRTPALPLIIAASLGPLVVFGIVAWGSKVEANWAAIYIVGASALIAPQIGRFRKQVYAGACLNIIFVTAYALHGATHFLPLKPNRDRVLRDTAGYKEVAKHTSSLSDLVLFDTYQTGAMLAFYQPNLNIAQWPGITRHSEFVRRPELNQITFPQLQRRGTFWLLSANRIPPSILGFTAVEESLLTFCKGEGLVVTHAKEKAFMPPCPDTWIRSWYAIRYTLTNSATSDP